MNKILKIHLYQNNKIDNNIIIDYCSFINEIKNYKSIIETFCLSALDFYYFKYFDQIVVYGKTKYVVFNKPIKNSNIVNYQVYMNNHKKIDTYYKELRIAHNLYKLIIHNYFKLND